MRRVLGSVWGSGFLADLSADVHRYHRGPQLFDALTFDSIADPTYHTYWDVPAALHAPRRGHRGRSTPSSPPPATTSATRPTPSTRACTQARCAPINATRGGLDGAARRTRGDAAPLGRSALGRALSPFDRLTASGNGFVHQCLPWTPTPPTPAARAAPRADAARRRQPRPVDTARVGAAAARPDAAREAGRRSRRGPLGSVTRGQRPRPHGSGALPARPVGRTRSRPVRGAICSAPAAGENERRGRSE